MTSCQVALLRLVLSICVLIIGSTATLAQLPVFRNYNSDNGLPSSETYQVLQDSRGYIYIGTDKGLVRFDGRHFETLTTREGLVNNTIFSLFKHKDEVWYYTYSTMAGYLKQDKIYEYLYNNVIVRNIQNALGTNMALDEDGTFYLNTLKNSNYDIIRIKTDGTIDRSLSTPSNANYSSVYIVPGERWLRSASNKAEIVKVFSSRTKKLLYEFVPERGYDQPYDHVYGAKRGEVVWILYRDIYRLQGKKCQKIISTSGHPLYMTVDKNENIWLGYNHGGLVLYRKKDNYANPIHLLQEYSVSCILEDREGGFWFTTLENGIYYLPPDFLLAYDQRTGLSSAKTNRISLVRNEIIAWQSDYSLWRLKNTTGAVWEKPLGNISVHAIALLPESGVYYFINPLSAKTPPKKNSYIRMTASKLFSDGETTWGLLNDYLIPATGDTMFYKNRLSNIIPFVTCLKALPNDRLLIGTLYGLRVYTQDQLHELPLNSAFAKERITEIKDLDEHHLLVATHGKGLLVLKKSDLSIARHITAKDGLKHMICNVVLSDPEYGVWVGTNMGLYKIQHILDTAHTRVEWASTNDGINSNEINDICIVGQDLWLGTAKGISIFPRAKKLRFEENIPVLLQKLTVNGKTWNSAAPLQLKYNQNNISIGFIGLNYRYATVLQYCYRLNGDEPSAWSYTSDPVVNYNDLPPGAYTFEYGAIAPNQYGKSYTATLIFTIRPPFWLRWWFILLIGLCVAVGIWLFLHNRLKAVHKQMKLKADLSVYRDKALRDQMSPHFIYNSLNTIQNYILKHDTDMSVSFLSKFSRLMRLIFNNTVQEMVTIEKDLEALQLYIEMERMRFPGKLQVHLPKRLPESLKHALIPPLLLQPFVENAVLHGLLPKNEPGNLWVKIEQEDGNLKVNVKDDGIGRAAAAKIKIKKMVFLNQEDIASSEEKQSGTTITIARIMQAWGHSPEQSRFKVKDLTHADGKPAGTLIQFFLPLKYDKSNNRR